MVRSERRQDYRRIFFQLVSFALCCLAAVLIRRLVATDAVSDTAAVVLEAAGLAGFLGAAVLVSAAMSRARGVAERVALRVLLAAFVLAGGTFVTTSYADVSVALHALATDDDGTPPTTIVLGPGGRDIRLSGTLAEGATRRLTALLAAHPTVERIHLTSDGGLVDEGEGLRKLIGRYKLTTFVPDYCVSACTLAFLGGHERLMMKDARLGFHSPFEEGLFGQTFEGDTSDERAAYISAGVSPDFVDKAFKVAPADIWTPDADVLHSAHIITAVVDRYRFPDSNLDGSDDLAGARTALLRDFPLAKALDASAVDAIAGAYLAAYREGLSEGEVSDGIKSAVASAATSVIAKGDDDTMVGFGRFLDAAMQVAESDADCVAIGRAADLLEAEEALDRGDGKAVELAMALLKKALRTGRPAARSQMAAKLEMMPVALKRSGTACAAVRGVYQRVLRLPSHAAAEQIRALAWQSEQDAAEQDAAEQEPTRAVAIVAH